MKTRTALALNTGVMWTAGKVGGNNKLRHEAAQDELAQFHWMKHDGKNFGMELLKDKEYDMTTIASFLVPQAEITSASWAQRIVVEPTSSEAERKERGENDIDLKSLFFYLGTEGVTTTPILSELRVVEEPCSGGTTMRSVVGKSKHSGWFRLELSVYPSSATAPTTPIDVTYFGETFVEAHQGARQMQTHAATPSWQRAEIKEASSIFSTDGQLKNSISAGANFISFAIQGKSGFVVDAVMYEGVKVSSIDQLIAEAKSAMAQQCGAKGSSSTTTVSRSQLSEWISKYAAAFDAKFDRLFKLSSKIDPRTNARMFTNEDIEVGKKAVSAVLGGIGHFYGEPRIGNALDSPPLPQAHNTPEEREAAEAHFKAAVTQIYQSSLEVVRGPPISLLTSTPSRTSFPRGFLWDEGYHQMVASQWDVSITMQILADWLNAQYHCSPPAEAPGGLFGSMFGKKGANAVPSSNCTGGWIPRELILGAEAERRVPEEFITQRVDIANPPTLLLVVESLLDRITAPKTSQECAGGAQECENPSIREEENRAILKFLQDAYPALHEWVTWLRTSQKGGMGVMDGSTQTVIDDTFRWRGRAATSEHKLIANTLASGLDDYPRSPLPSEQEFHLDLFCWVFTAARIMSRLETTLSARAHKEGAVAKKIAAISKAMNGVSYDNLGGRLQARLEFLHWSHPHKAFCDVGYSSDLAEVVVDLAMRCRNSETGRHVDLAVPLAVANSGEPFCPEAYPEFVGGVSDGQGGVRNQRRFSSPEHLKFQHIPRIGYLSLFPLLLRVLPLGNPRLDLIMDVMESTEHLWTDHGLRSISKNDTFYRISNAPGDDPYWRGPIWININYLALKALKHYITVPVVGDDSAGVEEVEEEEEDSSSSRMQKKKKRKLAAVQEAGQKSSLLIKAQHDQQHRMTHLYDRLRANVQRTVLGSFKETGFFWEHYDDEDGRGTRGHPFSGWTTLVLNIMAELY